MTVNERIASLILRVSVFISCFPHLRPLITADSKFTFSQHCASSKKLKKQQSQSKSSPSRLSLTQSYVVCAQLV